MSLAAMITYVALLNSTILTSTRMPFAMAEDGYLPHALTVQHPRYGTPWIAILVSAVVYGLLAVHSLVQLIVIYSWLRVATTVLTVLAAWQLRRTKPDMPRPFVIPGGRAGLIYSVAAVLIMSAVALVGSDPYGLLWGPVALAVGPVVYFGLRASTHHLSPRASTHPVQNFVPGSGEWQEPRLAVVSPSGAPGNGIPTKGLSGFPGDHLAMCWPCQVAMATPCPA